MTIKIIWRTDVHLSDRTPRSRTDVWRDAVTGKLRQVGEIARAAGADVVIDGGDFFDIKSPGRNPHDLVREVADIHEQYPCPVYANVGNHDCVYGDYEYLPQQPLGVLFATGVFKRLYDEHELIIEKDGVKVRVVGVPYHGTSYDLSRLDVKKGDEDHLVVICHLLASPAGGSMFENEDIVKYADLSKLDADVWMFGHWHKDQGIVEIAPGKWVVNTGSMTRGALVQDDMDRKPCAIELCFGGVGPTDTPLEIIRHNLKIPSAAEVFDVEGRARAEMRESVMDDFVTKLKGTLALDEGPGALDAAVRSADVPDSVRERAISYLENA
jgi:DNA repair exonuclease SbcCD nuclease subunit